MAVDPAGGWEWRGDLTVAAHRRAMAAAISGGGGRIDRR
jgi:hypothetical protein